VNKQELLRALQGEISRHSFDTFVDEPPSVAQGGRGVVVPGRPACHKGFQAAEKFVEHITQDVLPEVFAAIPYFPPHLVNTQY
jgi:hypothetical protein